MADLIESPSQTAGPYVHIGLATEAAGFRVFEPFGAQIAGPDAAGERIRITGAILDGEGAPMADALLEIWQADAAGRFADTPDDTGFTGFGRVVPNFDGGGFSFDTIKPGALDQRNGRSEAPHLSLWIVARGINLGLHTRLYFEDEQEANDVDPVLTSVPEDRRVTLLATRSDNGTVPTYRFDIHLQGDKETVFFDV